MNTVDVMVHQDRRAVGEKWFVFATMLALATEGLLAIILNALHLTPIGLVLGVGGVLLIPFVSNRLYSGNKSAYMLALAWAGFQIVYGLAMLGLILSGPQGAETARSVGMPVIWGAIWKVVVYAVYGWVLCSMPSVREFLAYKRGETLPEPTSVALTPAKAPAVEAPSLPLELSADHAQAAQQLASSVKLAVGSLMALGLLQIIVGGLMNGFNTLAGVLAIAEGALVLLFGLSLSGPCTKAQPLSEKAGQTTGNLAEVAEAWTCQFKTQAAVTVGLLIVWGVRFALSL